MIQSTARHLRCKPLEQRPPLAVPVGRAKVAVHLLDDREHLPVAFDLLDLRRGSGRVQIMLLEMHDVFRQLVFHLAVILLAAADEDDGERDVGETLDHLVDPARHPAGDIRKCALEQQSDVRPFRARRLTALRCFAHAAAFPVVLRDQ